MRAAACLISAGLAACIVDARRTLHRGLTSGTIFFSVGQKDRDLFTAYYMHDADPTPYGLNGISLRGSCFVVGEESVIAIIQLHLHDADEGYYSSTVSVDWGDESNAEQVAYGFMQQMSTDIAYSIPIIHTYSTVGAFGAMVEVNATANMLGNCTTWWTVHILDDQQACKAYRAELIAKATQQERAESLSPGFRIVSIIGIAVLAAAALVAIVGRQPCLFRTGSWARQDLNACMLP
jgi:hypothetical protein